MTTVFISQLDKCILRRYTRYSLVNGIRFTTASCGSMPNSKCIEGWWLLYCFRGGAFSAGDNTKLKYNCYFTNYIFIIFMFRIILDTCLAYVTIWMD